MVTLTKSGAIYTPDCCNEKDFIITCISHVNYGCFKMNLKTKMLDKQVASKKMDPCHVFKRNKSLKGMISDKEGILLLMICIDLFIS